MEENDQVGFFSWILTVQYNTIHYSTLQYTTLQYSKIQYSTELSSIWILCSAHLCTFVQ